MKVRDRVLLLVAAPVLLVAFLACAWLLLPPVRQCRTMFPVDCGGPHGVDVFGNDVFTSMQTLAIAVGIWASASILAGAILPTRRTWTAFGFAALALTFVVAFTLPSDVTGPPTTVACSSPGRSGPVAGRCQTGAAPMDVRTEDRMLLIAAGLICLTGGVLADRERQARQRHRPPVSAGA
jgi:hypothetical protein